MVDGLTVATAFGEFLIFQETNFKIVQQLLTACCELPNEYFAF